MELLKNDTDGAFLVNEDGTGSFALYKFSGPDHGEMYVVVTREHATAKRKKQYRAASQEAESIVMKFFDN